MTSRDLQNTTRHLNATTARAQRARTARRDEFLATAFMVAVAFVFKVAQVAKGSTR